MAMLKDTVVSGSLRATDSLLATNLILSGSQTARHVLAAPTTDGAPNFRALTNADVGLNNVTNDAQVKTSLGTTKGDMVYWSDSSTPARLAIGNAGYTLQATTNGPAWTQTVAVANGGTGLTTAANKNAVVIGNSSSATGNFQTVRTKSGAFYATAQDAQPAFGTLPVAQGGTGNNTQKPTKYSIVYTTTDGSGSSTVYKYTYLTPSNNDAGKFLKYTTNGPVWDSVTPGAKVQDISGQADPITSYWLLGTPRNTNEVSGDNVISNVYRRKSNNSDTGIYIQSDGSLYAVKVFNAVWNDIAEYRESIPQKPGTCVQENDNGCLTETNTRLIPGASIISDTFGFAEGKTDIATTPIAISGRVLAYTHQPRELYHAGMAVCSAPNGTVDIMTREEIQKYPDAIVGIVSEIPTYEQWGTGKVKIDGRIWIKIK